MTLCKRESEGFTASKEANISYQPDGRYVVIKQRIASRSLGYLASDEIGRGKSTFMVELSETSDILRTITPRTLIILDEYVVVFDWNKCADSFRFCADSVVVRGGRFR